MSKSAVTAEPFSLAGMGDMLRESNPDLATKVNVDEVEPPTPEPSPDPADAAPDANETPETETPAPEEKPGADAGNPSADELAAEQARQKEEADAAAKKQAEDAAQKAKDDAAETQRKGASAKLGAAGAAQRTPEDEAREKRDADLSVNLSPNTHPKTRQIITSFKDNARKARDERDSIQRERDALQQKLAAAETASKAAALPKEIDEELKTLRERVRELDITRDPALEAKYDKPIADTFKSAVDLLKSFGADQIVDPKDTTKTVADPRFETNLKRVGLSLKTLQPWIEKMEKAGYVDEAETLRESVRETARLARAKQQEVDAWKGDYENRVKTRTSLSQQQAEQEAKLFAEESNKVLTSEVSELAKALPFLNPPPAPLPTDSEPVRKAKEQAIAEYNASKTAVEAAVAAMNAAGQTGEKARAAAARLNANAVLGAVLKVHALPRLQKDMAAKDARIKELEAQIGKMKGATSLSRQHATLASAAPGNAPEIPANAATPDAFAAYAKSAGVNVNT